jgi:hypothetical protein
VIFPVSQAIGKRGGGGSRSDQRELRNDRQRLRRDRRNNRRNNGRRG